MRAERTLGYTVDRIGDQPIAARMESKAPRRNLDPGLLVAALALAVGGVVMVHSATAARQVAAGLDPSLFLRRQVLYGIVGLILLVVVSLLDYRKLRALAALAYPAALAALALVLTPLGQEVAGARRWIETGPIQMQPSEFAKLAVLVTLAAFLARREQGPRARHVLVVCVLVGAPSALIFLEPDLGTMMVFVALAGGMLLIAGAKIRHLVALGLLGLVAVWGALQLDLVHDYQVERMTAFMDATPDVRSSGYNLAQSQIAIASGGITGKGLGARNTQTSLAFVPEQHTDFIFTAVGEQLGFVGSSSLLALFAFLIWRALRIAVISSDRFGTLVAAGIAVMWSFQVFVNVGMTMGMMPITGIPLPFISFGGSSLITNLIAVALLLNVHMRRFA